MSKAGTAVVTGASSGIGLELARLLAADGYRLLLCGRNTQALQTLADELRQRHGTQSEILTRDLSQSGAAQALAEDIRARGEPVEILINNAGLGLHGAFASADAAELHNMVELNITALTVLTRALLPDMLSRHRGRVMNVASVVSFQPGGPGFAVYYASKAYVLSLSQALAMEVRGSGVSVTALCPGTTQTAFQARAGLNQSALFHYLPPMDARTVAAAGYRGMMCGRRVVVPGLMNKILSIAGRLPPSRLALEINRLLLQSR